MTTVVALGYARIHVNKGSINEGEDCQKFVYSKIGGIIAFCMDRRRQVSSLKVFDINNYRLIFQLELFVNMHMVYREMTHSFHCFPVPGMVLGVEYSRMRDALYFSTLINRFCPKVHEMERSHMSLAAMETF